MIKGTAKFNQIATNIIEILHLLNFRDNKAKSSQSVIDSSLRLVCKEAIINRLYGGVALLSSAGVFLVILGMFYLHAFSRFPFSLIIYYMASLAVLSYVFFKYLLAPLFAIFNKEKIALLIEQKYPSLNNTLISTIQFTRENKYERKVEYSKQMVTMLIEDTANRLKQLDLSGVVIRRTFLWFGCILLLISFLTFGSIFVFNRPFFMNTLPTLFTYFSDEKNLTGKELAAASGPVIGNITIRYRYPLYSGLESKTVYNSSGTIKALKGSEAEISAISDRPLTSAGIIINKSVRVPFVLENERTMKGFFSILEPGTYVFETTDTMGKTFKDPTPHKIEVETDEYPKADIYNPAKDLTVKETDTINLGYRAGDDFGISEIALVFEHGSEEKSKILSRFTERKTQYSGAYQWSLSELELIPDERVAYHIETKDRDTISGPKVTRSKTYYLEIYSSRKKHMELVRLQEELMRETLHMLADDLTNRVDDDLCASADYLLLTQDRIYERAKSINRIFEEILEGMKDDSLANYSVYYSLENLKNQLREISEKKYAVVRQPASTSENGQIQVETRDELQKFQDSEVWELEDLIIYLNEMIEKQKLDDVIETNKELIRSQDNLEKLLNDLQNTNDPELKEKVLSELKRIEESLQKMMEKLMHMAQNEHLDEFINADAMKEIEKNNLMENLSAVRSALEKGDLKAALQAAQEMLSSLEQMMNNMKTSSQNLADSFFSDTLKKTNQLLDKMSELEEKERILADNTEKVKKEIQKRTEESMKESFESFFEKQKERLQKIQDDIAYTKNAIDQNTLLQEYLRVNRELRGMAEGRGGMVSRFSDLFRGEKETGLLRKQSENLSELSKKNAQLNREINKDPIQRNLLYLHGEMPETEETLSHLEEMLDGWEIQESLNLAQKSLQNVTRWHGRVHNSLEEKKLFQSEAEMKNDIEITERLKDAAEQNQKIVKDLESIKQTLEAQRLASLTQEDKDTLQNYAQRQQELKEQTEELMEMMGEFSKQNPLMDEDSNNQLSMATESMKDAKDKLGQNDLSGAVNHERESLYRLAEAKKGMQMSKERIEQGMMGDGMPMPFRGQMDQGQFSSTAEKVEIPSEDAYKAPKEFRQDIMDALKQGLPEKYKDLNKDYYQRLVD